MGQILYKDRKYFPYNISLKPTDIYGSTQEGTLVLSFSPNSRLHIQVKLGQNGKSPLPLLEDMVLGVIKTPPSGVVSIDYYLELFKKNGYNTSSRIVQKDYSGVPSGKYATILKNTVGGILECSRIFVSLDSIAIEKEHHPKGFVKVLLHSGSLVMLEFKVSAPFFKGGVSDDTLQSIKHAVYAVLEKAANHGSPVPASLIGEKIEGTLGNTAVSVDYRSK